MRLLWTAALIVLNACFSAPASVSEPPGYLEKDFAELTGLFAGRWDNDRHVFFAEDAGLAAESVAPRQHIRILPADAADGAASFLAERSVEGEPDRRLIHTFAINAEGETIEHRMAVPTEDGVARPVEDCVFDWRRIGAQFVGRSFGEGCAAVFPRAQGDGPLAVSLTLSETEFWVASNRGGLTNEARFRRARVFECWTSILRGAAHGDSGEGSNDWQFQTGVALHDQGGVATLVTDEAEPRTIRLKLRDVDWPYGTNRPSLVLYVHEGGTERAVSYAWAEGGAERIGINLRWIQASCTHAPDRALGDL
ncbi:MAG: hypothetical protein AAFX03_00130 [Pseudomonadota bacterium]